ncbi:MAG: glycosyltransferase family 1 protein [Verrucomicrobia bacterium]|nr:MAG: glycosyltransferase family 1 protein [Verrucomicrobiota bacterium]
MRLSLVTETFPPEVNGVAMTLNRLVRGLADRGHEVSVVRPRQGSRDAPDSEDPYTDVIVPGLPLPRYEGLRMGLPVYPRLIKMWRRQRPDIVHLATEGPLGWAALSAAERLGLPIASSYHTNFHQYGEHYGFGFGKGIAVAYLRHFHNRTHCTMVPTDEMKGTLRQEGYRNVTVMARGVDTDLFRPERRSEDLRRSWGLGPDDVAVVYVGRLAKEKNVDLAVKAFEAMRRIEPRSHFVLVGNGPENIPLRKRYPDFHYCGMRLGEDLAVHYASGDIFLFPSITETFGNVVTEAMANGLLVLTYDYAAGRQFIRSWENGVLARLDDSQDYLEKAGELMHRRAEWKALRAAARDTALGITWGSVVVNFEQLLFDVMTRNRVF